jgi:peptidoglycan hydrolase CwlO-like protein
MIQEKKYVNLVEKELESIIKNIESVRKSVSEINNLTNMSKKEIKENEEIKELLNGLTYASDELAAYCDGFKEELKYPLYARK